MEAQPQMSDGLKIALTASFTVLGGFLIFVLQEFFLKPVVEQNKVIGLIGSKLLYYRPMLANPIQMPKKADELLRDDTRFANDPDQARAAKRAEDTAAAQQRQFEEYIDISKEIRELTGQLAAASHSIRWFWLMKLVFRTPNRQDVNEAIRGLHFLSHGLIPFPQPSTGHAAKENLDTITEIEKHLKIYSWGASSSQKS